MFTIYFQNCFRDTGILVVYKTQKILQRLVGNSKDIFDNFEKSAFMKLNGRGAPPTDFEQIRRAIKTPLILNKTRQDL